MATKNTCSTCLARLTNEEAPVLVMGAYGTPKLLCDECAALVETITLGKDHNEIAVAMQTLTERMSAANIDDRFTVKSVTKILEESSVRAQKIKEGTYDFSLDEAAEEGSFEDIPEELQETEEDRLLSEKEAEENAKFDKFLNKLWLVVGIAAVGYIIWKIISTFFLK